MTHLSFPYLFFEFVSKDITFEQSNDQAILPEGQTLYLQS